MALDVTMNLIGFSAVLTARCDHEASHVFGHARRRSVRCKQALLDATDQQGPPSAFNEVEMARSFLLGARTKLAPFRTGLVGGDERVEGSGTRTRLWHCARETAHLREASCSHRAFISTQVLLMGYIGLVPEQPAARPGQGVTRPVS